MFQLNLNFTHPLIKLQKLIGLLKNRSGMMTKIKCLNQEIALFRLVITIKTNSTCLIRYALKCFFYYITYSKMLFIYFRINRILCYSQGQERGGNAFAERWCVI